MGPREDVLAYAHTVFSLALSNDEAAKEAYVDGAIGFALPTAPMIADDLKGSNSRISRRAIFTGLALIDAAARQDEKIHTFQARK